MAVQYERIKKTIAALALTELTAGWDDASFLYGRVFGGAGFFAAGNAGVGHAGRGRPDWESDWDLCGTRA